MTNDTIHHGKAEPVTLLLILAVILFAAIVGKEIIAWILMKLHELFIQQNPAQV